MKKNLMELDLNLDIEALQLLPGAEVQLVGGRCRRTCNLNSCGVTCTLTSPP